MKRTAKTRKRDVGRPQGRKPLLNLRVDPALHGRLKASAAAAGFTVAEETVRRLARSFMDEDNYGADLGRVSEMMISAFWFAGNQAAASKGHSNPTEWLKDQDCYREALLAVSLSLINGLPAASPDDMALTVESLKGRVVTRLIADGKLKVKFEGDE